MLLQLDIQNIALIDHISLELGNGLNILTGETGAGKSIIIDSINAILGDRMSKDLIRTGKDKAQIEAVFQIDNERFKDLFEDMGIDMEEDGSLIISREFNQAGKNICRINGKMTTVSMLKAYGERLIDIHGQFDNQSLLRIESHIELLDEFAGDEIKSLKAQYTAFLLEYKEVKAKLKSLSGDRGERERKIDLLRFQIEEIKNAKLMLNEEIELNKQRALISSAEKIISSLSNAYKILFEGNNSKNSVSDNINRALNELHSIDKLDSKYDEISKRLQELSYVLDDIAEDVRKERDCIEFNPDALEEIGARLDLIFRLKRKYGSSIKEILEYCEMCEKQLDEIVKSEEIIIELNSRIKDIDSNMLLYSEKLNNQRLKSAALLEGKIGTELEELEMKKAKFKVEILFDESQDTNGERKYLSTGLNRVEFLISPNLGEPLKPLSKIASGGEMSRVMLAVKNILADVDKMPTLIFDEIDTGISGVASQKVGEKLSGISRAHQVICVTHLPQIASMADSHYFIEKITSNETTSTVVKKLEKNEIVNEIARILGGSASSEISRNYAAEMLLNAKKIKSA